MVQSVYFHIPFCEQICYYCDFNKFFLKNQPVDEYLDDMAKEMENTVKRFSYSRMKTAFVGGGTPSVLNEKQFDRFFGAIHSNFKFEPGYEFTFEANPGSLDYDKLKALKEYGVNRLSIGVQAFQDELLKRIGRNHQENDIYENIELARQAGFNNISIDLMSGLPGQTLRMFKESLEKAKKLPIDHVSSYSLQIEPKTIFYNQMNAGTLHLPPEEEETAMFEELIKQMRDNGFIHYEISNFAKPGKESKHNLTYWDNNEYYGIGAGAHSYIDGVRRENAGPLKKYMLLVKKEGFPYFRENRLTLEQKMEEEMFMGLRKRTGVSKDIFYHKFGRTIDDVYGRAIDQLLKKGLITIDNESVCLTEQGVFLGNEAFEAFLIDG
ncbi:oxygen-independent coproporphyrinogen III oxidase [Pueribacillus theae]|uniref:Heme chaperone HemW n=1 Tax=Pueribacillus theae TaxID=2171751 RepID=A0A2U1K4N5_9BACI|nr:radical SAM family heme chaperone HemW [Pueribacillus theae]PWA12487.1 oxygen-independent coproporphyrinogen III oxidase [Pueribacillus theae]